MSIKNSLVSKVEDLAIHNWQKYLFADEWLGVILITLILKIFTGVISVLSGFYYLDNFYFKSFQTSWSGTLAGISLLLIELLSAYLLSKFFKFALRPKDIKKAVGPFVGAAGVFALSFFISTHGIADYIKKDVDNSKEITSNYSAQIENNAAAMSIDIERIENAIQTIKDSPAEWKDGRRCVLSSEQLKKIDSYYNEIKAIKADYASKNNAIIEEREHSLSLNEIATNSEADKFYVIVAGIMAVQFICSGLLMFFWKKIADYKNPEIAQKECYKDAEENIVQMIHGGFEATIAAEFRQYQTMFHNITANVEKEADKAETAEKRTKKTVGFGDFQPSENASETASEITPKNASTAAVGTLNDTSVQQVTDAPETVKKCAVCGNPLTLSQIARKATYCCPQCRKKAYEMRTGKTFSVKSKDLK